MQTSGDAPRDRVIVIREQCPRRSERSAYYPRCADGSLLNSTGMHAPRGKRAVSKGEGTGRTTIQGMEPGPRPPVTARPASISGSRISLW
jgi:hypothetical protein